MKELNHIAVIIDGNRRFAKKKGKLPWQGHSVGADKVEKFLEWCKEKDIHELTLYVLSTENLKRDPKEVKELFKLTKKWLKKMKKDKRVKEDKIKISFIGDLSLVPKDVRQAAEEIEQETKDHDNYKLNLCFAYGGRYELVQAFNKLKDEKGKNEITEKDITNALWLSSEPDLIIRTSGHIRTSNFLPWQSVYSEWHFADVLWPEFTKQDLEKAIEKFNQTQRNFGK